MVEIILKIKIETDASAPPEMHLWNASTEVPGGITPGRFAAAGTTEIIAVRNLLQMVTDAIRSEMIRGIDEFGRV